MWRNFIELAKNSPARHQRLQRTIDYFLKEMFLIELVAQEEVFAQMYFEYVSD